MQKLESDIILKYFPSVAEKQAGQFARLGPLYREWNQKINVVSRKDIENLYIRHILHSLAIAKIVTFKPGSAILDAGTGGGFPGIPLAILFPEVAFDLVDSTAKKLRVVQRIADDLGLENISTNHIRLEEHNGKYDFVVSRAVSTLDEMVKMVYNNIAPAAKNEIPNGILYLKGGDFTGDLKNLEGAEIVGKEKCKLCSYRIYSIKDYFSDPFFETKSLIHLFS